MGRVILVVVILGVAAGGLYMFSRGFSARTAPNRIEAFIAPRLRNLAIPSRAREAKNPITDSADVMSEAMAHFADHCAFCHGSDGSGDTHAGKGLFPKPPNMRQRETQELTDGELYYIIENGIRYTGMPAFGESDNGQDEDTWKLVILVRHFPNLTDDQIAQIDQMTPKSPMELKQEEEIQNFLQGSDAPASPGNHKHHY
jgi:mono/diheme cytochrome c family protein